MKRVIYRVSVTAVILILLLAVFEIYMRQIFTHVHSNRTSGGITLEHSPNLLVDYTGGRRKLLPNASVVIRNHYISGLDVPITTNSLGFRGPEMQSPKPPAETRILVIGDSITLSDHLPWDATWVEQTRIALQKDLPGREATVINAGVMDTGITEQLELLKEKGVAIKPDLVLLAFYLNDSRPSWGFPVETRHRGWLRRHSLIAETIYEKFALKRWLEKQGEDRFAWIAAQHKLDWQNSPSDFNKLTTLAAFDWGAAWRDDSWTAVNAGLGELKHLSAANNFKAAIVVFPVSFQVYANFTDDFPQKKIAAAAAEHDMPLLDLLPLFRQARETKLFYDQCHLTPEAGLLAGRAVAQFLAAQIE